MKYLYWLLILIGIVIAYIAISLIGTATIIVLSDNIAFEWVSIKSASVGVLIIVVACAWIVTIKGIYADIRHSNKEDE